MPRELHGSRPRGVGSTPTCLTFNLTGSGRTVRRGKNVSSTLVAMSFFTNNTFIHQKQETAIRNAANAEGTTLPPLSWVRIPPALLSKPEPFGAVAQLVEHGTRFFNPLSPRFAWLLQTTTKLQRKKYNDQHNNRL